MKIFLKNLVKQFADLICEYVVTFMINMECKNCNYLISLVEFELQQINQVMEIIRRKISQGKTLKEALELLEKEGFVFPFLKFR